tara:strand:- start:194 stop:442 length:249 start_codon:yes stop_codon:yes gene_type:complete
MDMTSYKHKFLGNVSETENLTKKKLYSLMLKVMNITNFQTIKSMVDLYQNRKNYHDFAEDGGGWLTKKNWNEINRLLKKEVN